MTTLCTFMLKRDAYQADQHRFHHCHRQLLKNILFTSPAQAVPGKGKIESMVGYYT